MVAAIRWVTAAGGAGRRSVGGFAAGWRGPRRRGFTRPANPALLSPVIPAGLSRASNPPFRARRRCAVRSRRGQAEAAVPGHRGLGVLRRPDADGAGGPRRRVRHRRRHPGQRPWRAHPRRGLCPAPAVVAAPRRRPARRLPRDRRDRPGLPRRAARPCLSRRAEGDRLRRGGGPARLSARPPRPGAGGRGDGAGLGVSARRRRTLRPLSSAGRRRAAGAAAVRRLRAQGCAVELVLAGQPDPANDDSLDEAELRRLAAEPGIEWLGPVADVRTVWQRAGLAVYPSTYGEGVPASLLEAAACARPD